MTESLLEINQKKQHKRRKAQNGGQQILGLTVAFTGSLFMRGIIKHNMKKYEMETIRLVVPKNTELFIFVKGGK